MSEEERTGISFDASKEKEEDNLTERDSLSQRSDSDRNDVHPRLEDSSLSFFLQVGQQSVDSQGSGELEKDVEDGEHAFDGELLPPNPVNRNKRSQLAKIIVGQLYLEATHLKILQPRCLFLFFGARASLE